MMSFSRSLVELVSDPVAFGLRGIGQAAAFGEVLSDESIGVFVGASLP